MPQNKKIVKYIDILLEDRLNKITFVKHRGNIVILSDKVRDLVKMLVIKLERKDELIEKLSNQK